MAELIMSLYAIMMIVIRDDAELMREAQEDVAEPTSSAV